MTNYEIADHFSLLSRLMDVHGENSFKAKSYSSAAFAIERLQQELSTMTDAQMAAQRLGDSTRAKIHELQEKGTMQALEELLAITPEGILEMMEIKGLGPKKLATVWKELGIESVGELEYACNENRLAGLKGFGAKTQQNIGEAIAFYQKNQGFHLWSEAEATANAIMGELRASLPQNRFEITGEVRRQVETVAAVELITDADEAAILQVFSRIPDVVTETEPNKKLVVRAPQMPTIRLHLTDTASFAETWFLTTGSEDFMKAFLNKYKIPAQPETEEAIFSQNGLQFIPAALRETDTVLEKAAKNALNTLIIAKDIKGIIHSHSTWSDGADSIEVMAKAAQQQGFEYLVISDHSQAAQYAGGLTPDRIKAQHEEVDALNAKLAPFKIFKSIEADILSSGALDYTPDVLKTFDLVIASVHSNLKMPLERAMERLLAAIENPYTTILGHMTGRLLLSRKGYPVDHEKIIDACAANQVVVEINAHPRRLDIDWRWVEYAMDKGVLLSIDPDAHAVSGFRDVYYGAMIGQKGGLTPKYNLSSFSLTEFETFLEGYRTKKGN